ncbi:hypothetical protein KR093_000990 [Drosophila rubida]|uniref:Uncharacterized protein n=1 Tax=Drosophila rubida TaxID=30044 RepID=A0AAD4JZN6_9MUSC|nr:hypothetical protein KR093_000990 [Drosophila rubida]
MKYSAAFIVVIFAIIVTLAIAEDSSSSSSYSTTTPASTTTTKAPLKLKLCWRGNNWCNLSIPIRNRRCKSFFGIWKCYS